MRRLTADIAGRPPRTGAAAIPVDGWAAPRAPVRLQLLAGPDSLGHGLSADRARGAAVACTEGEKATDADLVRRSQAGERAAFTQIVERYKDRVYLMVRRMVGGPEDEDITQEVFLRAFQALPALRSGGALRTWLFRIAHNLCVTEIARRGARGNHLSFDEESEETLHRLLPRDPDALEHAIEKKDFADSLAALVAKLPSSYRAALTLYYLEGAKYEEIAEIMGTPLGTVKTHIRRAKLRLRDLVLTEMDRADIPGGATEL